MSDHIPFEIQSEIMKRLPVKSLIQFRSVSKQWKSLIDSAEFIKNYHVNHTNPQHHLFLRYKSLIDDDIQTYTSIVDNNTFPQQKFPLTAPDSLRLLRNTLTFGSVDGLLCFCGDVDQRTRMAVIWNPAIRKSVGIDIPLAKASNMCTIVGFGVCPYTNGPKLVKITVDRPSSMWVVEVFVDGVIYFCGYDDVHLVNGVVSNFVLSFDLKSDKFGQVCLPERLVHTQNIDVTKVNESLGLLEFYFGGEMSVCGVWTRIDGANNPFTKIYTIKVEGKWYNRVLGFRNNGEVVMELDADADNHKESRIEVYEPLPGHISDVGIIGKQATFLARSYMETLLLLDESDSIIH
ncbi:F-box domain containing protein [Tanacetum coccineum]